LLNKNNVKALLISIAVSLGTGLFLDLIMLLNAKSYSNLQESVLSPPMWLFISVWNVLYILMGVTAYLVSKSRQEEKFIGLSIYIIQIIFNILWFVIIFKYKKLLFAFVWFIMLWILIIAMVHSFYKINKKAGLIQVLYLLWATFVGCLIFFSL